MRNPVFRHAGSWRHAGRAKSLDLNRTPGGGAGLCFRCGAVCIILCTTWLCGAMTACHRLRGGILGCRFVVPACRRHPGQRNTGLRTVPTAYRGWKLPRLWSASPLWRSSSDGIPSPVQRIYLIYCKKCPAPRWGRAPGYILCEAVTSLLLIGF